jgi:dihydroorotase
MHEGRWSSRLGLPGIPAAAEESMVARDIQLVRLTGAPIHFLHLSTAGSVELVRQAKAEGLPVTAEAAPHHMLLTHALVAGYDPVFKVNPPLRTDEDVAAVVAGLCDGTIDAIATDHAPHAVHEKEVEFEQAPNGITGLETALGLSLRWLHKEWKMPIGRVLSLLSAQPAALLGLKGRGTLTVGSYGDVVVFDPKAEWTYNARDTKSKSRNTPFDGWTMQGKVRWTISEGRIAYDSSVA